MIINELESQYFIYITKILLYFFFVFFVYHFLLNEYKLKENITYFRIFICSILYGCCSIFLDSNELVMDRFIYSLLYQMGNDISDSESVGLDFLYRIFRSLSFDIDMVFFSFSFIYMFLTLFAYKYSNHSTPRTLLLLLFSLYFLYGFSILKQEISIAFMNISLMLYFNNEGFKFNKITLFMILLFLFFSIQFHEAAYICLPIFFILFLWDKLWVRILSYVVLILLIPLFSIFQSVFFSYIGNISETLTNQTLVYADNSIGINNFFTILKGIPLYVISYIGFRDRKLYLEKVFNYDRYLFISVTASVFVILSMYNYWLFRFSMYFYLVIFNFISILCLEREKESKDISFYYLILYSLLALSIKEIIQLYFKYGGF